MSSLSQFFQTGAAGGASGKLLIFGQSASTTIPSNATYASYVAMGGGGGGYQRSVYFYGGTNGSAGLGGGGAGFSAWDGPVSCGSNFTVCATVGAGGTPFHGASTWCDATCSGNGGTTSITGFSTPICATGGTGVVVGATASCGQVPSVVSGAGGSGYGGKINTSGGAGGYTLGCSYPWSQSGAGSGGGGGAGGLYGNGGNAAIGCYYSQGFSGGGGGFGSGGGGGGSICAAPGYPACGGGGFGGVGGIDNFAATPNGLCSTGTISALPKYTDDGRLSSALTLFNINGNGASTGCGSWGNIPAGPGGGGGGVQTDAYPSGTSTAKPLSSTMDGGFGAGAAGHVPGLCTASSSWTGVSTHAGRPGMGGGGAGGYACGYSSTGGNGIAAIEYWTN